MAKKKLLNEATVRRFMGLAGMKPTIVSNAINEMGYAMEKEMDPADDESPAPDMDMAADEPVGDAPEPEMDDGDLDLEPSEIEAAFDGMEKAMGLMQQLKDAIGGEAGAMGDDEMDAPDMDADMDDDMDDMEEGMYAKRDKKEDEMEEAMHGKDDKKKKEMMDEELSEVDLQLSEEEIVQEVARRVAQRIIKAKRAKSQLDEALGRKK